MQACALTSTGAPSGLQQLHTPCVRGGESPSDAGMHRLCESAAPRPTHLAVTSMVLVALAIPASARTRCLQRYGHQKSPKIQITLIRHQARALRARRPSGDVTAQLLPEATPAKRHSRAADGLISLQNIRRVWVHHNCRRGHYHATA